MSNEAAPTREDHPLSGERAELFQLLRGGHTRNGYARNRVREGNVGDRCALTAPVSLSQQRLWFIDQLEGAGAAYHIAGAVRLRGTLDGEALQAALDTLVSRHEVLRTVFASVEGEPVQVIDEPQPLLR